MRSIMTVPLAAALLVATALSSIHVTAAGLSMTSFSPKSGPVGTPVTIIGTGFAKGDVVAFNGTNAASASPNSPGTKLTARVPAFATSGVVTVTDPTTGQRVSLPDTPFRVTTGVYSVPSRVWAGGKLVLSGSGLSRDQSVPIYMRSTHVGTAVTDRNGDFQIGVSVPWSESAGQLAIYALDPNFGRVTTIIFVLGAYPQFHHDAARTGEQTFETSITPASVPKLKAKWAFYTSGYGTNNLGAVDSSPVVADGIVYVGSDDGYLYAIHAGNGKKVWSFNTGGPIKSAPAVANGRVFVYSTGGVLYALNSTTGKLAWQRSVGADPDSKSLPSSPVAVNGMVYVGSYYDGILYAFKQTTGSLAWDFPTNGALDSPAFANGTVYVGSQDGHVYAVNASTGHQVWSRATGEILNSSPSVVSGQLYVGTNAGYLYSLNASNGSVTWSWSSQSANKNDGYPMESSPAVYNGLVFIGDDYGCVNAVVASTGKLKWQGACGFLYQVWDSPTVAGGVLFVVGGQYEHIYGLNPTTGATLWDGLSYNTSWSSPAVSNGMVYVGSDDKYLIAFGL